MFSIHLLEEIYIDGLIALYNQLLPKYQMKHDDSTDKICQYIFQDSNYTIIIGTENEKVISTCTLIIIPNLTHFSKPFAIIENVVTHEDYRKLGYGTQVLKFAIQLAKKSECHKILLQTRRKDKHVLEFYKKLGFTDEDSTGFMIDFERGI